MKVIKGSEKVNKNMIFVVVNWAFPLKKLILKYRFTKRKSLTTESSYVVQEKYAFMIK